MFEHQEQFVRSPLGTRRPDLAAILASVAVLAGVTACGGGNPKSTSTFPAGSVQVNPATGYHFVVDSNVGGNASSMHARAVYWGRLADIYARDTATNTDTLLFQDFMIGEDVDSDGVDYELTRHPVTGKDNRVILHPFGSPEFSLAFATLEIHLQPFLDKSLASTELPPFTAVPRNGAVVVVLDDLLADRGNPQDNTYP